MIYNFNHDDTLYAVSLGQQKTESCIKHKRKDNHGLINNDPVEDARRQTIGYLGELAVCRLFDKPLVYTPYVYREPDLWVNDWGIQVKASERANSLTIRPDAEDFHPYVLCHIQMPSGDPRQWYTQELLLASTVTLVGWIFPFYARLWAEGEPSLWRDPNGRNAPAIFMPASWLCDIESLLDLTTHHPSEYDFS